MLLLSIPSPGAAYKGTLKRGLYVCVRSDHWEARGWGWLTGSVAGKALTAGAADREKLGQSRALGVVGEQSRPHQEEDKRHYTGAPCLAT